MIVLALLLGLFGFISATAPPPVPTNVPAALFLDNNWVINVAYILAQSDEMYNSYQLDSTCFVELSLQELYCTGKSVNATIVNRDNSTDVRILQAISSADYGCATNIQDPQVAVFNPIYSHARTFLPAGRYNITMSMKDATTTFIRGYRGFAIKASIPDALIASSTKCRPKSEDPHLLINANLNPIYEQQGCPPVILPN